MKKWVPITERLPNKTMEVEFKGVAVFHKATSGSETDRGFVGAGFWERDSDIQKCITHWREKPIENSLKEEMMKIEVKMIDHQFAVYIDGKKSNVGCDRCIHNNDDKDCDMAFTKDGNIRSDDKMYAFCGNVCGYFDLGLK